jgi:hypothetical protein
MTRFAYEVMGHISFITVGTDEVRAWTLRNGDTALNAAATIHSDLCRGFIRAECFSYDDLMALPPGRQELQGKGRGYIEYTFQHLARFSHEPEQHRNCVIQPSK